MEENTEEKDDLKKENSIAETTMEDANIQEKEILDDKDTMVEEISEEGQIPEEEVVEVVMEDEDADEEVSSSHKGINILLMLVLVLLVAVGGIIGYHLYPSVGKVDGTWQCEENGNLSLVNEAGKSQIVIKNYQNNPGMTLIYENQLKGNGVNKYKVEGTDIYIKLNRKKLGEENIKKLTENKEKLFKIEEKSKKEVELHFTKKAKETVFGKDVDLDSPYRYAIQSFSKIVIPESMTLKNPMLSEGVMHFSK